MLGKRRHPLIFTAKLFLFIAAVLIHTTKIPDLSIKTAYPFLVLPLLAAFSFFHSPLSSALAGFLTGACIDSVATSAYCFNTLFLTVAGMLISLFSSTLFNKNLKAAAVLSLILAVVYYLLYWFVFIFFVSSAQDNMLYLLQYGLPTAVYSSVFIFPFYWFFRLTRVQSTTPDKY